jgi:tRNA threonylcarbamoyladenosine biosynthesis protein TsaB
VRVLGIETATWTASIGIVEEETVLAERTRTAVGSHAISLLSLIDEVLAAARLSLSAVDLIALSVGPGSFTGLRIGLSVAKGIALGADKPVIGVPTLTALAYAVGPRAGTICPVLDARKHEVYAAAFEWSAGEVRQLWAPAVLTPEALAVRLRPPCLLCGDGVDEYESVFRQYGGERIETLPSSRLTPRAGAVALLGAQRFARSGGDDIHTLEPSYVRASEAEQNRSATI